MIIYIKEEDGKIYKVLTTKTEIDLEALKQEVANLKAMTEPSDAELIDAGRMMHPYYTEVGGMIDSLEEKIAEIEKAIKQIEVVK